MGNLPVEYAISRGWHANVVEALLKAHPAAATSLDPAKNAKKFDAKSWKPESVKGCRWLRKIAEECVPAAHDDVLRLLPKPSKDSPPTWTDGQTVEDDLKEKERKKEEKRLKAEKRRAAKEAKAKAKADKAKAKEEKAAAAAAAAAVTAEAEKEKEKKKEKEEGEGVEEDAAEL